MDTLSLILNILPGLLK